MQLTQIAVNGCTNEEEVIEQLVTRADATPPGKEEPISVAIGIRLQRMNLISDTNSLHIDAFLTREWMDNRLNFDDSNACRTAINGNTLKIWLPQLTPINGDAFQFHTDTNVAIVHSNGSIIHGQRFDGQIPCLTDALSYPFGNTTCTLIFQNEQLPQNRLQMKWSDTITRRPFATAAPIEQVGDLKVMHISFLRNISAQSNGNFDKLILEIHFSRSSSKTLLLFYLPSVLIVCISWLSLVLGPMAITRAIMNIGAFVLLLLHYSSNMADLPRTTGITAIDIWKIGTMLFVLAILFELVIVTCMASVGRSRRLTRCCRRLPRKKGRYSMEPLYEELNDLRQRKTRITCSCCRYSALIVDFISLNVFAATFILFTILYFSNAEDLVLYFNDFQMGDFFID
ncbi:Glycine receptor subunit alpha-3 [Toxocara canis]|uniref:Glycine receptor subunit alpha-3 n=1 Tax=Toxocara canis TaxID=6265 RepID=A0A0B2W043_TOXCA|nr:Glycine receptor subunit alpha-3 [Toxocara canis]